MNFENFDKIRTCVFRPYCKGMGPVFRLQVFDTTTLIGSKSRLAYKLFQNKTLLFEGDDFGCSPLHAIDSNDAVRSLMGFLTLRPGDTEGDYFDEYTPAQLEFAGTHAEVLDCEVEQRFERIDRR